MRMFCRLIQFHLFSQNLYSNYVDLKKKKQQQRNLGRIVLQPNTYLQLHNSRVWTSFQGRKGGIRNVIYIVEQSPLTEMLKIQFDMHLAQELIGQYRQNMSNGVMITFKKLK